MSDRVGSAASPNQPVNGPAPSPESASSLEVSLRAAIANDELRLVYQPEYDLISGRLWAVEALVRWQHPELGELGPTEFIELAEQSDLIETIGSWVIDQSTAALAAWLADGLAEDLTLRVNVSPLQVGRANIVAIIADALRRHRVPGDQVCIELTENTPPHDLGAVARSLHELKELGVTSAIDDLATGYSTLSSLRVLPVDTIKIDRSLVTGIDTDPRARAIVSAIVVLGRELLTDVVGEGVESDAEAATLRELGCTRAQGHLLGRPASAQAIATLLSERRTAAASSGRPKKTSDHGL